MGSDMEEIARLTSKRHQPVRQSAQSRQFTVLWAVPSSDIGRTVHHDMLEPGIPLLVMDAYAQNEHTLTQIENTRIQPNHAVLGY